MVRENILEGGMFFVFAEVCGDLVFFFFLKPGFFAFIWGFGQRERKMEEGNFY